ncbi:phosphonate C-P lyase system protein PhnH [Microvirga lotononidis]|uniref:Phosphonate C-P lyase system protein PhnH n=1 Tax=Microvirga lotononidis TaxID=864069 RepID=I4YST8_9HYPH|nr:phosphonate C-P lyase system protein PhnH [Microvirga lotononidis]EIM27030.1 phosphonate C-P lyase system protein PhnH [Microvirga lotononidis]WQO28780.1 phosphonate C-P lyase system protein PhnH [Microvirga lotononidis]
MAVTTLLDGGFADPVLQSQATFRLVMDAMAQPGRIVDVGEPVRAPAPLDPAAAAFLATLADYDTTVWFEDDGADAAASWLTFHTGAPVTKDPSTASFVLLSKGSPAAGWLEFPMGSLPYPDRSATLLLPVESLRDGTPLTIRGPGIETVATIAPCCLPDGFIETMAINAARFPQGFDLVLICGSELLALPRTTRLVEA